MTPYLMAILVACLIAGICTLVVWLGMNNVHQHSQAAGYTTPRGLCLTGQYEHFLRRTRSRHRIKDSQKS